MPLAVGARGHPFAPIAVVLDEDVSARLVDDRPPIARQHAAVHIVVAVTDFAEALAAVEGARGAEQVARCVGTGMPHYAATAHSELHHEVCAVETGVALVSQRQSVGRNGQHSAIVFRCISRHLHPSIDNAERCMVFKLPIGSPLHAYQTVGKNGETGIALYYYGTAVRHRVVAVTLGSGCRSQCHQAEKKKYPLHYLLFFIDVIG